MCGLKRLSTSGYYEEASVLLRRMRELQATLDSREHKYTEQERRLAMSREQLMRRFARAPIEHGHTRKTIGSLREDMSALSELSSMLRQESEACAEENVRLKQENKNFAEENRWLQMQINEIERSPSKEGESSSPDPCSSSNASAGLKNIDSLFPLEGK